MGHTQLFSTITGLDHGVGGAQFEALRTAPTEDAAGEAQRDQIILATVQSGGMGTSVAPGVAHELRRRLFPQSEAFVQLTVQFIRELGGHNT